jgi:hypothetical protein
MDFGYVLKRAWKIIWKFKVLWIFGILASCGQSSGSGGNNLQYTFSSQDTNVAPQIEQFFNQLNPAIIATFIGLGILVLLALIVLAILLGTVGRIGLIRGTVKAEEGAERLTFGELWREGLKYFWRVFGLNLLIGLVIFLAVLAIFIPGAILTGVTLGLFAFCFIPMICLLVPVMWAVYVVIEQANIALVVENLSITKAISRGWGVVRENIGSMIVMSLVLILGVSFIGGIIIGLPLLIIGIPMFAGIVSGTTEAIRNGMIISGLFFLAYLPIMILLSGILRSYTSSAWTLTYLRLTNKPEPVMIDTPDLPLEIGTPPVENA